jgi:hypothetical protein
LSRFVMICFSLGIHNVHPYMCRSVGRGGAQRQIGPCRHAELGDTRQWPTVFASCAAIEEKLSAISGSKHRLAPCFDKTVEEWPGQ